MLRHQSPDDLGKKIEIKELSCDDEVFEIVEVLNQKNAQISRYVNHLQYVIGYIEHEFNTPLATLSLGLDRLQKKHPEVDIEMLKEDIFEQRQIEGFLQRASLLERETRAARIRVDVFRRGHVTG